MPNGHDRNWFRLCGAVDGFFVRFGHWPTRVRLSPGYVSDLQGLFTPEDWDSILSKVDFVSEEAPIVAEDDAGNAYSYGQEGFPDERPTPDAWTWFGVFPRPEAAT